MKNRYNVGATLVVARFTLAVARHHFGIIPRHVGATLVVARHVVVHVDVSRAGTRPAPTLTVYGLVTAQTKTHGVGET